jgi:hypothetical protein
MLYGISQTQLQIQIIYMFLQQQLVVLVLLE